MVLIKRNQSKIYGIIAALITLIVPFFLMLFNENNHLETDQSLCLLKVLTGFPCPSCGITKSMVYFYEGDLQKSVYYHLFGPLLIAFSFVTIIVLTIELIAEKEYFNAFFLNKKPWYGLLIFLASYHFVRIIYFIKNNSIDDILLQSIWK